MARLNPWVRLRTSWISFWTSGGSASWSVTRACPRCLRRLRFRLRHRNLQRLEHRIRCRIRFANRRPDRTRILRRRAARLRCLRVFRLCLIVLGAARCRRQFQTLRWTFCAWSFFWWFSLLSSWRSSSPQLSLLSSWRSFWLSPFSLWSSSLLSLVRIGTGLFLRSSRCLCCCFRLSWEI